ncbi:MAG: hypothetical protein MZV63_33535 [Marinilabiliales bacterium]|nr:hypothetical protein [Marinilabiliales bacterium]
MTFVDRNDKVKYFSQGGGAHLPAQPRHPATATCATAIRPPAPTSLKRSSRTSRAAAKAAPPSGIRMGDKFVHIEYFALRDEQGVIPGDPGGLARRGTLPAGSRASGASWPTGSEP